MASANAWLQKQRKGDLADIAEHVGLKNYEKFKKMDLEMVLEEHLRNNSSALSKDPKVEAFYQGVDPASPVKHERAVVAGEKKPRQRRQTLKARDETDTLMDTDLATTLQKTPSRALALARSVPLPPSPAVLADRIEAQTTSLRASLSQYIDPAPVRTTAEYLRNYLSSVNSIELLTLLIEFWGLRGEILPARYLTTIPAVPALGTPDQAILIPDLFALLTGAFWGPFVLWAITSIALPLLGGWFVNLNGDGGVDAVSFNVVKGLVAWIVYARGGVRGESRQVVERGVPGGTVGMLVGAGVGGLAGVWEGVLRK